ncbi:3-dehydroquinate synthase [Raphidiopsis brookii D9]|nr:3-dehydroquinate synthase [Raphidiopsis brookii D9]
MCEALVIQSHRGSYTVRYAQNALHLLALESHEKRHFIIDANVVAIYHEVLNPIISGSSALVIEATESAKTLDRFTGYVEALVSQSMRRDHRLIAIGGGITQDITAFLATTLLRGVAWEFYPTTLLAQADSCIGSKSSINVGPVKNILGTYCPPNQITIDPDILKTLKEVDFRSGIGEILKVHAIAGPSHYDEIAAVQDQLKTDHNLLRYFINRSLEIKKTFIESDEFDTGPRNVMNYGHSFGHAIEAATDFFVPHGIAVTIGMDLANHVAMQLGHVSDDHFNRMHPTLMKNSEGFHTVEVPRDRFFAALSKDKKNIGTQLSLILLDAAGLPKRTLIDNSEEFCTICNNYFLDVLPYG